MIFLLKSHIFPIKKSENAIFFRELKHSILKIENKDFPMQLLIINFLFENLKQLPFGKLLIEMKASSVG